MSSRIENSSAATRASTEPMQRSCMRLSPRQLHRTNLDCVAQPARVARTRTRLHRQTADRKGARSAGSYRGKETRHPRCVSKSWVQCRSVAAWQCKTAKNERPVGSRNMDGTTAGGRGGRSPAVPSLRTLQGARGGVYRGFDGDDDRSWRWIRVPQQEWRGGRNSDALTMQTASDDIRIGFDEQRKRLCTGRGSQFDFDEAIAALLLLAAQPQRGPSSFRRAPWRQGTFGCCPG